MRSSRLRRIIAAYTVNRLGTWFGLLALLVAVYDHTHSALAVAGLMLAGQALPALFVPAVVARVETSRRRSQLSTLYLFEALVTTLLVLLTANFSLPAVLVLVALDGTAALAASSLLRAEIARVAREETEHRADSETPPEQLDANVQHAERRANAALNVAFSSTFVIGPPIGGVVVAAAGAPTALLLDVGSFLLGAALLADLSLGSTHEETSVRNRLREAWRHLNDVPPLGSLLIAETVALIFIETGGPIEVTFVKSTLNAGDRGLGVLLAAWGAGSVLGSIVFARLVRRPLGALLCAGTVAIGSAYIALALAPSLALACVAGVLGGIGNGLQWPALISAVQRLTPQHLQGRLMGGVESLGALCISLGLPLGGVLVAVSSPRSAFALVGAGALLATVPLARAVRTIAHTAVRSPDGDLTDRTPTGSLTTGEALPSQTSHG